MTERWREDGRPSLDRRLDRALRELTSSPASPDLRRRVLAQISQIGQISQARKLSESRQKRGIAAWWPRLAMGSAALVVVFAAVLSWWRGPDAPVGSGEPASTASDRAATSPSPEASTVQSGAASRPMGQVVEAPAPSRAAGSLRVASRIDVADMGAEPVLTVEPLAIGQAIEIEPIAPPTLAVPEIAIPSLEIEALAIAPLTVGGGQ